MATQEEKKSDSGSIQLMIQYWPLRFRGNFLKLILEEKSIEYSCTKPGDWKSVKDIITKDIKDRIYPVFAPPILTCNNFISSQMPACCQYLAKKYGMDGLNLEDSTHALMICMNCNDIFHEVTRANGAQMWTYKEWIEWKTTRLIKWLDLLTLLLKQNNNNNNCNDENKQLYYFGNNITYADTSVFHVIYCLINDCGMEILIKDKYNILYRFCQQINNRKNIKAFVEQQKVDKLLFCGGNIEKSIKSMVEQEQKQ
eukprot:129234_1